jgi:broad specificity phosphatase PhoE
VIVLVRHGQTAANADGLLLGRADPPLTELGHRQAAAIAGALTNPGAVITSPLLRARQTAAAFGIPVVEDERWIELDYGDYDGRPVTDVPAEVWAHWRRDVTFTPPGGESLTDLGERVRGACEALQAQARDEDVVVVSHVSPIKAAVAWGLGVGDEVVWRLYCGVATISRIGINDRGPVLNSFNESRHLDALDA